MRDASPMDLGYGWEVFRKKFAFTCGHDHPWIYTPVDLGVLSFRFDVIAGA